MKHGVTISVKTKSFRRFLAVTLALLLVFSLIPAAAYADGKDATTDPTTDAVAPATETAVSTLRATLAEEYKGTENDWAAISMAACGLAHDVAGADILESARAVYENDGSVTTDFAKAIMVLTALGVDASRVYSGKDQTYYDLIQKLGEKPPAQIMDAVCGLLALDSGDYDDDGAALNRESCIKFLLESKEATDGGYAWVTWGDDPDVDTTAMAITALAPYYTEHTDVKETVYGAQKCLAALQNDQGHYGNSMSTAMVIVAQAALGHDPGNFANNGNSLIDGLLSFRVENQFGYANDTEACEWSTEQAFRALVAYTGYLDTGGKAFNIYRFGPQTGDGTALTGETVPGTDPVNPTEPEKTRITVYFTLEGLSSSLNMETWLSGERVTVRDGDTVADVIIKALQRAGYGQTGAQGGYITSVTTPDGFTLSAMHDGLPNSGWLYKVNFQVPTVGIAQHVVNDGDHILLYFTKDYTLDPDAGTDPDSKKTPDEEPADEEEPAEEEEPAAEEEPATGPETEDLPITAGEDEWTNPFTDVGENDWFFTAVRYINSHQLMAGAAENEFAPHLPMTRAMLVTVLHRLAGEPAAHSVNPFADVVPNAWYAPAVAWARENNIVAGYGHDLFGTHDSVTREQLAAVLCSYAAFEGLTVSGTADFSAYSDADQISPWARSAMEWATALGLIGGRSADALAPQETATRAEVAAIVMRYRENTAA